MPGPYDIYPAVDLNYAFPAEVRTAAANSAELKLVLDSNVAAAVAAAKVSPAFTGTPTAPDASSGDASGQLANTRWVGSSVASAITASKVSPAFSGTPTAPTPGYTDNSTRVATTAYAAPRDAPSISGAANFTGAVTSTTPNQTENNTRIATTAGVRSQMALFGLGSQNVDASGDWNNYLTTGFYKGADLTSAPASGWFWVTVQRYDDTYVAQSAIGFTNENLRQFLRTKTGGNWSPWREIAQAQGDFDSNANWNDLRRNGTYRGNNASGGPNGPGGYGWGILHVFNGGGGQFQMWYPDQTNAIIRTRVSWGGSAWTAWRSIRTTPDDFSVGLFNGASGSVIATREGRWVNLNFNVYCGSGFGINGVGTIANIPDGARPQYLNAEVIFRTSDGYTVWGTIQRDNGNLDWRNGGTGGQYVSGGNYIYGTVTYMGQY